MLKKSLERITLGLVAAAASTVLLSSQSHAIVCDATASRCLAPTGGGGGLRDAWETKVFAGLQWNFGDKETNLIFGVRRTQTDVNSVVRGAKFDIAVPLNSEFAKIKPIVRIMGVAGNRDVQAEFGLGFKTLDWKPIIAGGVQVPYFNIGTNYIFDNGFKHYAGINSLKCAVAPRNEGGALSCDAFHSLQPSSTVVSGGITSVDPAAVINGQTCFSLAP